MANNIYGAIALTGGATGALDAIDGAALADKDIAIVVMQAGSVYTYVLDADSAAAESSPGIIQPDANGGDKRWILVKTIYDLTLSKATTGFTVAGGTTSKTLTVSADMTLTGYASAAEDLAGAEAAKATAPLTNQQLIKNLKPAVNASVNKLDIFTKSGGAAPDASNIISVAIPDGNGYTFRSRAAAYLSGTSQFIMADAANYWSKGSLDAEIKTAYVYAIWDGTGIVWALGGYSGFIRCPASTTATDDDFFLLEEGSTYTKAVTKYCVCVGKIRYQYDTADTPDHTIQATVLDAPQVIWNPKSDYGYSKTLATTVTQESDIAIYSVVSLVVKQSGKYLILGHVTGNGEITSLIQAFIKTGSATYASAVQKSYGYERGVAEFTMSAPVDCAVYLNAGDTIHLGGGVESTSATRSLFGDSSSIGLTGFTFIRID